MTEVLSVKYEETGKVVYVLPNQNYQVGDYLVIKNIANKYNNSLKFMKSRNLIWEIYFAGGVGIE